MSCAAPTSAVPLRSPTKVATVAQLGVPEGAAMSRSDLRCPHSRQWREPTKVAAVASVSLFAVPEGAVRSR
eukprot:352963-Pyramimonas_sp.AAC.1